MRLRLLFTAGLVCGCSGGDGAATHDGPRRPIVDSGSPGPSDGPNDAAADSDGRAGDAQPDGTLDASTAQLCAPTMVDADILDEEVERRDPLRVQRLLLLNCVNGEDCANAQLDVDEHGIVEAVRASEQDMQDCAASVLLGVCLPGLAGQHDRDFSACGI